MTNIQRYDYTGTDYSIDEHPIGTFVFYDDAVLWRDKAVRDALAAAAQRVEALNGWNYGDTAGKGPAGIFVARLAVIAAIKGEQA